MIEKFVIGEIAIVACQPESLGAQWNGREVEIKSALRVWPDGSPVHSVSADWLPAGDWVAHPWSLRKRREPPDWLMLTKPQELETA